MLFMKAGHFGALMARFWRGARHPTPPHHAREFDFLAQNPLFFIKSILNINIYIYIKYKIKLVKNGHFAPKTATAPYGTAFRGGALRAKSAPKRAKNVKNAPKNLKNHIFWL